jgi:hypothetical protein
MFLSIGSGHVGMGRREGAGSAEFENLASAAIKLPVI